MFLWNRDFENKVLMKTGLTTRGLLKNKLLFFAAFTAVKLYQSLLPFFYFSSVA
jgi:hypothetical protein